MNLSADMEARAAEAPDRIGLTFEDGSEYTYGQINRKSCQIANYLVSQGVGPGDRVGVYMQNAPAFLFIIFGIWKTGAVLVPINIMYQAQELIHAVSSTHVDTVITDANGIERLLTIKENLNTIMVAGGLPGTLPAHVIDFDARVSDQKAAFDSFVPGEQDVAAIMFTGGTTGAPKAVITNHMGWYKALCDLAGGHTGNQARHPIADDRIPPNLVAMPLFHGGGQQSMLFAYHIGRSVLLMERFKAGKYLALAKKYNVRSLVLMPTMIHDIVNYDGDADLRHVRTVTSIGQELRPLLRSQFEEKFNIPILMNYGSTEVGHVAGWGVKDLKKGLWKPGSVGKLYPGVTLQIRGKDGAPLPAGEIGEIFVKSTVTTKGYAGNAEESKSLLQNGWICTGDMGCLDEDGVLFIKGRKREMIKCGGFQVWPLEIEKVLMKHPKINDVAVVGVPDDRMGEIPKAFIILQQGTQADSKEIIDYCRDNLAHFKAVRAVQFVDAFPRADTGKILKEKLKDNDNG
ncbi:MAG: acyl--CoA ligase [Desulfatitalea sp.]|nr:acyl--CoA ligase [Desulfatitalea sp.]NNK01203.1 acyl--CoA ligase [Desulfatitalea sp.]